MTTTVLVPSSLTREADSKRAATRKLGSIARAATVFRVDRIIVFADEDGDRVRGGGFVATVLRYAATPPYLRTEVWGRRDELEYAGVLPPLHVASQTGSGPTSSGSLRQGIVTEVGPDGRVRVTCGLQHPVSLRVPPGMGVSEGERVTIRVSSREPVRARIVEEPLPGYRVSRSDLTEALTDASGVTVATSRHGSPLSVDRLAAGEFRGDLTVAFGAPERGLPAILDLPVEAIVDHSAGDEPLAGFGRWLNTVPDQGSEVVRTEEAILATLAPLRLPEEQA